MISNGLLHNADTTKKGYFVRLRRPEYEIVTAGLQRYLVLEIERRAGEQVLALTDLLVEYCTPVNIQSPRPVSARHLY